MTNDTGGVVISSVRWRRVAVPFRSLVSNAQATYRTRESVLFEAVSDGVTGIGEAALPAGSSFDRDGDVIDAFIPGLLESTLGRRIAAPWRDQPVHLFEPATWQAALVCGLETAVADAAASLAGLPLHRWLAREADVDCNSSSVIEANGLVDLVQPEEAASAALALAAEGFHTIKMKVGGDPNVAIATVAALRAAIGPDIELRCDANQSWDYDSARTFLRGCAPYNIALCEEPLASPGADFGALARLRVESPVPLAIDESTRTLAALEAAIRARAAEVLVVKPMSSGLREGLAMVRRARGQKP